MPAEFYYLFDMRDGKRVTLQDLYAGSEDDFKKIVVDETVERWKQGDAGFYDYYSPEDEKEKREEFREYAGFDMTMEFTEDSLVVYYQPYMVGPYAAGFIDVTIPYSKLGISLNG